MLFLLLAYWGFGAAASTPQPSAEAAALYMFLASDEILFAEPHILEFELDRMSDARQGEVARELMTMLPDKLNISLKLLRLILGKEIASDMGKLTRQFSEDALSFAEEPVGEQNKRLIEAQNQALIELGLPSLAWVQRSDNRDYRRRWSLKVEQLLREGRDRRSGKIGGPRFAAWRAGWLSKLKEIKEASVRKLLLEAIANGLRGEADERPILVAAGGPIEGPPLTRDDVENGKVRFVTGWPAETGSVSPKDLWVIERPSGQTMGLYDWLGLPLKLTPERFDSLAMVDSAQVTSFSERLIWADELDEATRLAEVVRQLPDHLTKDDFAALIDHKLGPIRRDRPDPLRISERFEEVQHRSEGSAELRRLIGALRLWKGVRTASQFQWRLRDQLARAAGRPRFSLKGLARDAAPVPFRRGGTRDQVDLEREIYDTRSLYEVRGEVEEDVFHLHEITTEEVNQWSEVQPTGRPRAFQLRPIESEEVHHGQVPLPTALHFELTDLEVFGADERKLTAGSEFKIMRHHRTGSYALRFRDPALATVKIWASFARDRSVSPAPADVPLLPQTTQRLDQALNWGGERELRAILRNQQSLSARGLNDAVKATTRYSYSTQYNEKPARGPLAEFARLLDPEGRYCVQCDQVAHILRSLLELSLPTGYGAVVETALLRTGTSLIRPTHAVVDIYLRNRPLLRLNPSPLLRDPRAPTAAAARALAQQAKEHIEATDLHHQLARLSQIFGDHARMPHDSPVRRMYRLGSEVQQALRSHAWAHSELSARAPNIAREILADLPRWTKGVPNPGPRERRMAALHARAEIFLEEMALRIRSVAETEASTGCQSQLRE